MSLTHDLDGDSRKQTLSDLPVKTPKSNAISMLSGGKNYLSMYLRRWKAYGNWRAERGVEASDRIPQMGNLQEAEDGEYSDRANP